MTHAVRTLGLSLLAAMCAVPGAGCKKDDHQSLVLAELKLATADPRSADLMSVTLMATPGPTQTFPEFALSPDTGVKLGLYLSGSITGDVTIMATAKLNNGCIGFRGTGSVTINAPGMTWPVPITMTADNTCPGDGGAAGSGGGAAGTTGKGGAAGTGTAGAGTAGTGGGGTAGASGTSGGGRGGGAGGSTGGGMGGMAGYPSISSCRTFNHGATSCPSSLYVNAVAISPDGRLVASAGNDGQIKIWNFDGRALTAAGAMLLGFTGTGAAFSPDGTRFIHTAGTTVRTYTVAGWVAGPTLQTASDDLVSAAFTPNGQRIVSANGIGTAGGDVFAHEVGGSVQPAFTKHIARQPASLAVSKVAASDGSVGVVVGTYNATVAVLTLGTSGFTEPTVLNPSALAGAVFAVRFSADGSLVSMGDDNGTVRFWAFPLASTTPPPVGNDITFSGGDIVDDIAFSPNGMYVAVGGGFTSSLTTKLAIYNLATHTQVAIAAQSGDVNSLVFTPNGAAIIAGLDECGHVMVCP